MVDMLAWGIEWLSNVANITQTVEVSTGNLTVNLDTTPCDNAGRLLPGQAPTITQNVKFLFEASEVANSGITFRRNTVITWNDSTYHVVSEGNRFWAYNDSFKRKIVVSAKHVSLSDS